MVALRIRLFGCPAVSLHGAPWTAQSTRAAQRLLGYLALNGRRPHPREKLAALLWQDAPADRGRNALKTTLWRLRRSLEPAGVPRGRFVEVTPSGAIGLNWDADIWCDALALGSALAGGAAGTALRDSVLALEGELLEGFYDDWILLERERMNAARAQALGLLMVAARDAGQDMAAMDYGRRILDRDPLRESVHREMIRLHLRSGQRVQALRQYETCAAAILSELGIDPMPETRALFAQIAVQPAAAAPSGAEEIRAALGRVEDAMRQLSRSHSDLVRRLAATTATGSR